jgi:arsenate reductase (thioredoxin)
MTGSGPWPEPTTAPGPGDAGSAGSADSGDGRPAVLFLCVHNAGRSQMAAGWLRHLAGDAVDVYSAGSAPAAQINPVAVAAMAEVGIDIVGRRPQRWTDDMLRAADLVVTMGCGDSCPVHPGTRYEDWELPDPAGQPLEAVRPIRDAIEERVRLLLAGLDLAPRP